MANEPLRRKLRMGLIGGGGHAFIGRVHSIAATLDQRAEVVAGALSSDPERSRASAAAFGIPAARAYGSYVELIAGESQLPQSDRIDFVTVATPNDTHFEIAQAALRAGFHVVCDKPLTTQLEQAKQLAEWVERTGAVFAVTYAYAGYAAVRQAREMVRAGELGQVQAARVSYIQGGLRAWEPGKPPGRAAWKADPERAGPAGTLADIGTHAFHLLRHVTGLVPGELACQLRTFSPGRRLDDYGHVLLRCSKGELGTITFSQVTHGRMNDLAIEVDGDLGSLVWRQEESEVVVVRRHGKPVQTYERNPRVPVMHEPARLLCRLPGGHSEGFLEAFANIYRLALEDMVVRAGGGSIDPRNTTYPNVYDGVEGVEFVEQCLASHCENGAWKTLGKDGGRC